MEQFKAIKVMSKFSKEDIKNLSLFLKSYQYHKKLQVRDLFDYCKKYYPGFSNKNFNQTNAIKALSKQSANSNLLSRTFSELYSIIEDFIAYDGFQEDEHLKNYFLLKWFNNHDLPEIITKKIKHIEKERKPNELLWSRHDLYGAYLLEEQKGIYAAKNDKRSGDINIQNVSDTLDIYYLKQKMTCLCAMITREQVVEVEYQKEMIDEIVAYMQKSRFKDIPFLKCWYSALLMVVNSGEKNYYDEFEITVNENDNQLSNIELRLLYVYLTNETRKHYSDTKQYYTKLLELYKLQLNNKTLYYNGKIQQNVLKNIITVAVRLEETEWAKAFLEQHREVIVPDANRESIYSYSMYEISFTLKDYNSALGWLSQLNESDIYYTLAQKRAYIKVWYETKNWPLLDSSIGSYRTFIHRLVKISKAKKDKEKSFIHYIQKLMLLNKKGKKGNEMVKEINEMLIPEKYWLRSKFEGL